MLKSGVKILIVLFLSRLLASAFLTDTGSGSCRVRYVLDSFLISVATQFDQVMYTSSIIIACYATDSQSKRGIPIEGRGSAAPSVLTLYTLRDRSPSRIGWSFQHNVTALDQLATSVAARSTEKLVQRHECAFYILEVSTARNREESFKLVHGLFPDVIDAVHAFSKNVLEDNCSAVLSSELYTKAPKKV